MIGTLVLCVIAFIFMDGNRAEAQGVVLSDSRAGLLQVPVGVKNIANSPGDAVFLGSSGMTQASATKYVVTGAVVGAALYGVGLAIYFSQQGSGEFAGHPAALVLPGVAAAGLGAVVGYLVYLSKR